jgi:hypothetical protein
VIISRNARVIDMSPALSRTSLNHRELSFPTGQRTSERCPIERKRIANDRRGGNLKNEETKRERERERERYRFEAIYLIINRKFSICRKTFLTDRMEKPSIKPHPINRESVAHPVAASVIITSSFLFNGKVTSHAACRFCLIGRLFHASDPQPGFPLTWGNG